MDIQKIIAKKRDRQELSKEEIEYFITNYTNGNIPDYQAAALTMAIYLNGMTEEETTNLTLTMAHSGDILDLSEFGTVVDKHSTGGIGDKVTLILAPIIASLGIPVAKMSGRGLGYTGGTIDKLEAIPGYRTNIKIEEFKENVGKIGISLMGQTLNLAPADKKLYALRDTIAATESIPLISSSIMSKKIAAGANKIVLDVTCGSGAFMKDLNQAIQLAKTMKKIGELAQKETVCVVTSMEEPLGKAVGNALEVIEAIQALKGNMTEDVQEVVLTLGAYMMKLADKGKDIEGNKEKMLEQIQSGEALKKLKELIQIQGGDVSYVENIELLPKAKYVMPVLATKCGYVKTLDAKSIGEISMHLGAGRMKKEDSIDPAVGIVLEKKIGDYVKENEILAYVHTNNEEKGQEAVKQLLDCYQIVEEKVEKRSCILKVI
ncbi:MAG: thymidine phosphorylase [Clostridia bacterium]|nr:thymidine phosphorylase [Clostridia bacterium]MCI9413269.1 thymidine phosphorylase [Clostridia bacterium]